MRFGDLSPSGAGCLGGRRSRPGRLPASYKGLATFAPVLFHNFFHSCGNLRGETLRSCRWSAAGKGLYHSDSTPDNHALTPSARAATIKVSPFEIDALQRLNSHGEGRTHISAEPAAPEADPRIPRPDGDQKRPAGSGASPRQRPQAPRCHRFAIRELAVYGSQPAAVHGELPTANCSGPKCRPILCLPPGGSVGVGSSSAYSTPVAEPMAATSRSLPHPLPAPTPASVSSPVRNWAERS